MSLRLDWCSYEAAKFAVERWHYSKTMPRGKNNYIGVWEDGEFRGVVLFGIGSGGSTNGERWGLNRAGQMAELVRVALRDHKTPVSQMVSYAVRMVAKRNPGLRLIVSFADPNEGHVGAIYQAANWLYTGLSATSRYYVDSEGRRWHERLVSKTGEKIQFGVRKPCLRPQDAMRIIELPGKYRYLYPLDKAMRRQIEPLAQPYPKRADEV